MGNNRAAGGRRSRNRVGDDVRENNVATEVGLKIPARASARKLGADLPLAQRCAIESPRWAQGCIDAGGGFSEREDKKEAGFSVGRAKVILGAHTPYAAAEGDQRK